MSDVCFRILAPAAGFVYTCGEVIEGVAVFIKTEEGYYIGLDDEGIISDLAISKNERGVLILCGTVAGERRPLISSQWLFSKAETEKSRPYERTRIAAAVMQRLLYYVEAEQRHPGKGYIPPEFSSMRELLEMERENILDQNAADTRSRVLLALNRANARMVLVPLTLANTAESRQMALKAVAAGKNEYGDYTTYVPVIVLSELSDSQIRDVLKKARVYHMHYRIRDRRIDLFLSEVRPLWDENKAWRTADSRESDLAFMQACNRRVFAEHEAANRRHFSSGARDRIHGKTREFNERHFREWEKRVLGRARPEEAGSASRNLSTDLLSPFSSDPVQTEKSLGNLERAAAKKVKKDIDL